MAAKRYVGVVFLLFCSCVSLYSLVISKLMPDTGNYFLDAIKYDWYVCAFTLVFVLIRRYYCFLCLHVAQIADVSVLVLRTPVLFAERIVVAA